MELDLYDDTYKRFCDLLPTPAASVLEIGCGPGNITRRILTINPDLKILATDISKNMVDLAKRNNPGIEAQVLDCRYLKDFDTKRERIICGFTIPFLSKIDCTNLIANCSLLLKEKGILYLSFVAGDYEKSGFKTATKGDRVYFYYHKLNKVKQDLALNHLVVVDIYNKDFSKSDGESETHTVLVAMKQASNAAE